MMPQTDKKPRFQAATRQKAGDTGDKTGFPNENGGFGSGDKVGTKWGHFYMMKLNSINLFIPFAPPPAISRPVSGFAGSLCTLQELSAKGIPLEQRPRRNLTGARLHDGKSIFKA